MRDTLMYFHLAGFAALGGALITAQINMIRAERSDDVGFIADVYRTIARVNLPMIYVGASILLATGLALTYHLDYEVKGWLLALILLFAFEAIEGNIHYTRRVLNLRRLSTEATAKGSITPELSSAIKNFWERFFMYIDVPNFALLTALAVFKPF